MNSETGAGMSSKIQKAFSTLWADSLTGIINMKSTKTFKITAKEFKVTNWRLVEHTEPKRVICYAPNIWRQRYYRQSESDIEKGLKVLTFKSKVYAESVAQEISSFWKEEWIVEEITP